MATKSKKRSGKKAAPGGRQAIPIYLTDGQKAQAEGDIRDHGHATFEIKEIDQTNNTVTTSTVHR